MRILKLRLVNYIGILAAMNLVEFELSFENIDKSIIQLYGRNKCGKTVVIRELHPYSCIDFSGDERNDLPLIVNGEVGIKQIIYEVNGKVYDIVHTHRPNGKTHSVSSSIMCDGIELNESQKVTIFNNIIENIFGVNKYIFQFIINGTDLNAFGSMNSTQRKTLLNKAMGIDQYDKINKLATDDYRYTSKLISSLNNTKEFLLSKYGSYETLSTLLANKQKEFVKHNNDKQQRRSELDSLNGKISILNQSDITQELNEVTDKINTYNNIVGVMGNDMRVHDELVNEQISINDKISQMRNQQNIINKDLDNLFDKKMKIENDRRHQQQLTNDYNNMNSLMSELKTKISDIHIHTKISCSSEYIRSLISVAQTVNSMCKEVVICLNKHHLELFHGLIKRNIDISDFLLREGSVLMDGEKEKSVISRIRSMINNIDGIEPVDCKDTGCLYRNSHLHLNEYFKSYQSSSEKEFTTYDIEQMDHAYKNIQVIRKLINIEVPDELSCHFDIIKITENLVHGTTGIDVSHLQTLMNDCVNIELRNRYCEQLMNIQNQLKTMDSVIPQDNATNVIEAIEIQITELRTKLNANDIELSKVLSELETNDKRRMMLSQIKHLDIKDLMKQQKRLSKNHEMLQQYYNQASAINVAHTEIQQILYTVEKELQILEDANVQYTSTVNEIEKYLSQDMKSKIIAEATSSTKGKPIIVIRQKILEALRMTNRLLKIMWEGEVEILIPTIDASQFTIPFRTAGNISSDIRYGSQSEKSLLLAALNLSLSALLSPYNIPLLDEIDAFLDSNKRDSFIEMIVDVMTTLKIEQLFLISHNTQPGQYDHLIHTIDITNVDN